MKDFPDMFTGPQVDFATVDGDICHGEVDQTSHVAGVFQCGVAYVKESSNPNLVGKYISFDNEDRI